MNSKIIRSITAILIVVMISTSLLALTRLSHYFYVIGYYVYDNKANDDSEYVDVNIPRGASISEVSNILYDNNIVKNKEALYLRLRFMDIKNGFITGRYRIFMDKSLDDILYGLIKR